MPAADWNEHGGVDDHSTNPRISSNSFVAKRAPGTADPPRHVSAKCFDEAFVCAWWTPFVRDGIDGYSRGPAPGPRLGRERRGDDVSPAACGQGYGTQLAIRRLSENYDVPGDPRSSA
jgi:hypothetical protein